MLKTENSLINRGLVKSFIVKHTIKYTSLIKKNEVNLYGHEKIFSVCFSFFNKFFLAA